MTALVSDLRFAARFLRKTPGVAGLAILTLALGIGANTAIFSVINTLLLRPPLFEHLTRLVYLVDTNPHVPPDVEVPPSPANFVDWRAQSRSFDHMVAWRNWYHTLAGPESASALSESVRGVRVSPSFFQMIGTAPALGRAFRTDEGEPGRARVVVLSDRVWKRRFGADPGIIGRRVLIDAEPFVVVGVLKSDFQFYLADFDLWMPLAPDARFYDRENHSVLVFARLASGVSLAQAQAEMDAIAHRLEETYPDSNSGWGVRVLPLHPTREVRDIRPSLLVLLGAAGFVLLIACANVANLLLARAVSRQREIAIRTAVGATRARLVRQMLTESVLLASIGAGAGLLVARWGVQLMIPLLPRAGTNEAIGSFRSVVPTIDPAVFGFSLAAALITGTLFGLLPAVRATRPEHLKLSGTAGERSVAGRVLMAAELALSIVLLIGATLLLKSFWRLQDVNPGFRSSNLLTMQLWLPRTTYPEPAKVRGFYDQLLARLETLPGVQAAGAVSFRPFLGMAMSTRIEIEGRAPQGPDHISTMVGYSVVTPGYLHVLGQQLLSGRDLAQRDGPDSAAAAVINQAMARSLWPNEDPIGKRIRPGFSRTDVPWAVDAPARWLTVVGVAADVKEFRLDEEPRPSIYISYRQFPSSYMFLMVRTINAPESLAGGVRGAVRAVDRDLPVSNVRTMDEAIAAAVPRVNVQLLAVFAALAVLLSAVGVYGVTSYAVSQRTKEIGTRIALGASPSAVVRMVVRDAVVVSVVGVALGVSAAYGLTRVLSHVLYGVTATDSGAFIFAAAGMMLMAVAASYFPARRAAGVDPLVALRSE